MQQRYNRIRSKEYIAKEIREAQHYDAREDNTKEDQPIILPDPSRYAPITKPENPLTQQLRVELSDRLEEQN